MSAVTHYDVLPIPPVEAHTRWFEAGALRIGVEYRLLDDAIAAAHMRVVDYAGKYAQAQGIQDCGVSLHVCGQQDGEWREFLRFDCFDEDPHYHYISQRDSMNDMVHLEPVANGDPLAWALERLRTRLPQMLARARAADVAKRVELPRVEEALSRVAEAAYRARYAERNDAALHEEALRARAGR
jgi:hypothetical protein